MIVFISENNTEIVAKEIDNQEAYNDNKRPDRIVDRERLKSVGEIVIAIDQTYESQPKLILEVQVNSTRKYQQGQTL